MPPLETRTDSPGESPEEPQYPGQNFRGILSFRTHSTQDLRPRHRPERNPERPPCNLHGDWPFLRPPERVPVVPVLTRETLPNSRKSRRFSPPGEIRPISSEASGGSSHLNSGNSKGPCCNSRSSPTYPSPLERKHEGPAHIQTNLVSAWQLEMTDAILLSQERFFGVPVASQE